MSTVPSPAETIETPAEAANRKSPRRPLERAVHIVTGVGRPAECMMLDISEHGARVRVDDAGSVPEEFLLRITGGMSRWCRIAWRSYQEIGVSFIETPPSVINRRI